jgi:hypothetical protein
MRFCFGIIVLTALLNGVAAAQAPPAPPAPPPPVREYMPDAWKEFTSAAGKFSISLPGTPKPEVRTMQTRIGKLTTHAFVLQTDFGHYYVHYVDFPVGPETPEEHKEFLDGARDQVVSAGSRVLVETDVAMGGVVARELLVEKGPYIIRARYFFVKSRSYQVIFTTLPEAVFKNAKPSANTADRTDLFEMVSKKFFGSFKVIE